MGDRDRSDAPTAVERPGGSAPSTPDTSTEPSISPIGAALSTSAFDPPDDRFEMRSELGRGGMGRVDEAFDRALGRPVAIKHMLAPSSTELARFEREARITARLEHPGIVPIHDAGRSADGTPYYVMRRVDGRPLSEVARDKSLDERLALVPNLLAVCDAVAFAHARGVIHRDIKPTNILIGPFGETLLIDWGLAREIAGDAGGDAPSIPSQSDLTRAGTVAGTPGFMSPEQARGEGVDARADVFALGVTLFYVLAGRLPWKSSSATEMINAVGAGRDAEWHLLPAEVPAELRAILEKAMASDVANRYVDGGALAADLRRFITGNLVGAYTYDRFARLLRVVRRHRAAVAVAVVSLVIVGVVAAISVRRVVAERDDANAARALAELRQREARDTADGLLVDTARQLALTNPIAAIAKLRQLPAESKRWREAWGAATTAWFKGVPFGLQIGAGRSRVQISSDSKYAFVMVFDTGKLTVIDLLARTRRDVATLTTDIFDCGWFDSTRTIACVTTHALVIVDVASGGLQQTPVEVDSFVTNRASKILIRTVDNRVFAFRSDGTAPTEIARDVTELKASADLEWMVIVRDSSAELRNGDRTWPVDWPVTNGMRPSVEVRNGVLTMMLYAQIRVFQVIGNELRSRGTFTRPPFLMSVFSALDMSYTVDFEGISVLDVRGVNISYRLAIKNVFPTMSGFVVGATDGKIVGRDKTGWFELGARPLQYRSVDESPDERFLATVDDTGTLFVWDLRGLRGTTLTLPGAENPGSLTDTDLYTVELGTGIHRHPLAGGTSELVVAVDHPMTRFEFDPYGRWVAGTVAGSSTVIYDTATRTTHRIPAVSTPLSAGPDGLSFGMGDGSVWQWTSGANQPPKQIGTLPVVPEFMASSPGFILAVAGTRDVMRLHLATGVLDRMTAPGDVFRVVSELDGRAWLLVDGVAWRWDLGKASPVRIDTADRGLMMTARDHGVLLFGAQSLTLLDGDTQRLVAAFAGTYRVMENDLLALVTPTQSLRLIDLVTMKTVDVTDHVVRDSLLASTHRFGASIGMGDRGQWRFLFWGLGVPREPAALQRWLATITNAKLIPGSDAVAWPAN